MNAPCGSTHQSWNKGKLVGQKAPLRLRDIWGVWIRLELARKVRDLALFDLAIDSKLRACDLTKPRVRDVAHGRHVAARAMVIQQKTPPPYSLKSPRKRGSQWRDWVKQARLESDDFYVSKSPENLGAPIQASILTHR